MGKTLSSLMAKVVYVAKMQNLKNGPNFDRLERPPKINNFETKIHTLNFFWYWNTFMPWEHNFSKTFFSGLFWSTHPTMHTFRVPNHFVFYCQFLI